MTTLGLGGAAGWGEAVRVLAATGNLIEDNTSQTWAAGAGLDVYFTDFLAEMCSFRLGGSGYNTCKCVGRNSDGRGRGGTDSPCSLTCFQTERST